MYQIKYFDSFPRVKKVGKGNRGSEISGMFMGSNELIYIT